MLEVFTCDECQKPIHSYQARGMNPENGQPICWECKAVDNPMPMCPFCNRETTYVVPDSVGFHCMNCGGDFDRDGEPIYSEEPEPENDEPIIWDDQWNWEQKFLTDDHHG